MKRIAAILIALLVGVLIPRDHLLAQTPTATPTGAYDFPSNPTVGQIVTGPHGQQMKWDGVKWVAVPGAGGVGGGGGTVTSITAGTGLTGGTITTTGTIGLDANPTGGQLNYAPIASPTFSGIITANSANFNNGTTSMPTLQLTTNTISQILFPTAATPQGSLTSGNTMGITLAQGARYSGTQWIATNVTSAGVQLQAGNINFYSNSGLPILNPFTPTLIATMGPSGTNLKGPLTVDGAPVGGGNYLPLTGGTLTGPGNLTVQGTLTQNGAATFGSGATVSFGLQVPNWISVNGNATFNGVTTAPTVAAADNSTNVATTAFVKAQGYAPSVGLGAKQGWTPSVQWSGTVDTTAQVYDAGYTKVGSTINGYVGVGNVGNGQGGCLQICGLPYPVAANSNQGMWPVIVFGGVGNMTGPMMGMISGGNPTCISMNAVPPNGNVACVTATNAAAANLQFSFSYVTD